MWGQSAHRPTLLESIHRRFARCNRADRLMRQAPSPLLGHSLTPQLFPRHHAAVYLQDLACRVGIDTIRNRCVRPPED